MKNLIVTVFGIFFYLSSSMAVEPCPSGPPGTVCVRGGIFAGTFNGKNYMVTPGNCTDSQTPVCDNNKDSLKKTWGADGIITGVKSVDDGKTNTQILTEKFRDTAAAKYCRQMNYGGYSDWFLPAENEQLFLKQNSKAIGSFNRDIWYWTSTESSWPADPKYEKPIARVIAMWDFPRPTNLFKKDAYLIRCIRTF